MADRELDYIRERSWINGYKERVKLDVFLSRNDRDRWKEAAKTLGISAQGFVFMIVNYYARRIVGEHWELPERLRAQRIMAELANERTAQQDSVDGGDSSGD